MGRQTKTERREQGEKEPCVPHCLLSTNEKGGKRKRERVFCTRKRRTHSRTQEDDRQSKRKRGERKRTGSHITWYK